MNQAGVDCPVALVSHIGYEEQGMDVRGFQAVTLLGLSDSLVAKLSALRAQWLLLIQFSSKTSLQCLVYKYFVHMS